jgi:hypothetical protein
MGINQRAQSLVASIGFPDTCLAWVALLAKKGTLKPEVGKKPIY